MSETWDFDQCVTALTGEIELLRKISKAQDRVRQAVMNREWTDFDEKVSEVNRMGEEFAKLDKDRARLLSVLSKGAAGGDQPKENETSPSSEEKPFYALILHLPLEEGRELSRLYRELKMETLKLRALNESFLAYLNEAKTMAAAYLEAVCPARGAKLYTSRGRMVSQDLRSLVFNNQF